MMMISFPQVLDAADAVRAAIIGWSGAALQGRPQLPEHRSSRLRGLAASVMRASRQRPSLLELAAGGSSSTAHLQGAYSSWTPVLCCAVSHVPGPYQVY